MARPNSFTVRGFGRSWEICPRAHAGGSRTEPGEQPDAGELRHFLRDAQAMRYLRQIMAQGSGHRAEALTDARVFTWFTEQVRLGRLVVRERIAPRRPSVITIGGKATEAKPKERPAPPAPAPKAPPIKSNRPPPVPLDVAQQVAALTEAASSGVPFCEQCEKKRQAAAA